MLERFKAAKESKLVLAITCLLLIAIASLFLHYSVDGTLGASKFEAIEKASAKGFNGIRQKSADRPALVVNKGDLPFVPSFSLFRFDFKQNLRTWPVLSNGLERSPPTLAGIHYSDRS
jgi:hypothetical protein